MGQAESLPSRIRNEQELDELLSRPWPALVELMGRLSGDIMVLGAGGKMGPSLARMAQRAMGAAGCRQQVIAVGRGPLPELAAAGVSTLRCDLLDLEAVERLPQAENVIFMAGRKFGTQGSETATWASNVLVPYHVARTFQRSRIVVFSTGCVYPLVRESTPATEETPPEPVGEYAQSCLGRERIFQYLSEQAGERVSIIRLNYAIGLRYGVLQDLAARIWSGRPVDVTTGHVNVIWQGDACNMALLSLRLASSPPRVLNVTGPETISVRETAQALGQLLGKQVEFVGEESGYSYLSDASQAIAVLGSPRVSLQQMLAWSAQWVMRGGTSLGKPTHFEVQDGKF